MGKRKTKNKTSYSERMVKHYGVDADMKFITYKGAFALTGIITLATVVVPFLLSLFGIDKKIALVCSATVLGGLGVAWVRCFLETKSGFGRGFVLLSVAFGFAFFLISYYWTYFHYFI